MADVDVWQAARQGLLEDVQVRVDFSASLVYFSPRVVVVSWPFATTPHPTAEAFNVCC